MDVLRELGTEPSLRLAVYFFQVIICSIATRNPLQPSYKPKINMLPFKVLTRPLKLQTRSGVFMNL